MNVLFYHAGSLGAGFWDTKYDVFLMSIFLSLDRICLDMYNTNLSSGDSQSLWLVALAI